MYCLGQKIPFPVYATLYDCEPQNRETFNDRYAKVNTGRSVILIGMPGAGKSTIGVMLAKVLTKNFVDTDVLIQVREGKNLQTIINESGYQVLSDIEQSVLLESDFPDHVVATGGSVVYCREGMIHLKRFGTTIFLNTSLQELKNRIHNYTSRGIVKRPEQSFEALFQERQALYRQYADIVIECDGKNQDQILKEIDRNLNASDQGC